MRKVHVIRPGSLKQIIGPAGTLKRIIKNESYFKNRGFDLNIYTYDSIVTGKPNVVPKLSKSLNKNTFKVRLKKKIRANLYRSKFLSLIFMRRAEKQVEALVDYYFSRRLRADYVVFHSVYECYYFLRLNKNKEIKTICFFHSDGIPLKMEELYFPKLKGSKYFNEILEREKYVVENVDCCVFISEKGRQNFLNFYPFVNKDKTRLILNGIEDLNASEKKYFESLDKQKARSNFKYNFCCVGTINIRKGQKIIIDALKSVSKENLDKMHFTFVGDGAERVVLEQIVLEEGLDKNVKFVGAVDNSEVYKYLLKSDIYILMSLNEGLPISIIEAMRVGLPVISTKIAGIPELVNKTNGVLTNPDVNELLEVFQNIDNYDWKKLGEASRKRFLEEFTFDRMKKEYCDILDSLE